MFYFSGQRGKGRIVRRALEENLNSASSITDFLFENQQLSHKTLDRAPFGIMCDKEQLLMAPNNKWIAQNIMYLMKGNGCLTAARRGMLSGLFTCVFLLCWPLLDHTHLRKSKQKGLTHLATTITKRSQKLLSVHFSKASWYFQTICGSIIWRPLI